MTPMTVSRRPSKSSTLPRTSAAAEAALPQAPADQRDGFPAGGLFLSGEEAALNGLHAEDVEQRGFGERAADPLRLAIVGQVERGSVNAAMDSKDAPRRL